MIQQREEMQAKAEETLDEMDKLTHGLSMLARAAKRAGFTELSVLADEAETTLIARAEKLRALVPPTYDLWTGP